MFRKLKIRRGIKMVIAALSLLSVIGFTESRQSGDICKNIVITIHNQHNNYFINEEDVLSLMTENGAYALKGVSFKSLNLKEIEERVKTERFIRRAEIYKDLKGNLLVKVDLRRPLARVIREAGPDAYIAEDGAVLPVSNQYVSRVTLISGAFTKELVKHDLLDTDEGKRIFRMLRYINDNKFWKAQIAEINIDKKLNMVLYPQVTKQYVEFGKPEQLDKKFRKLEIFYKQILPQKGWNRYDRVNLMYEGQVIAE